MGSVARSRPPKGRRRVRRKKLLWIEVVGIDALQDQVLGAVGLEQAEEVGVGVGQVGVGGGTVVEDGGGGEGKGVCQIICGLKKFSSKISTKIIGFIEIGCFLLKFVTGIVQDYPIILGTS